MVHYLGYQPSQWNKLAQHDESRRFVERAINRHLTRIWMPELSPVQFKVYSFIIARTLGWQKYAEAIPMSHFLGGMREADGFLYRMEDGEPACAGTGIKKDDTVREAIRYLRKRGMVSVFLGKPGTVTTANVYLPLSERNLAILAIKGGIGVLPEHLEGFYLGEHVKFDGAICQVIAQGAEDLRVQQINKYGNPLGEPLTISHRKLDRVEFSEWRSFKSRSAEEI